MSLPMTSASKSIDELHLMVQALQVEIAKFTEANAGLPNSVSAEAIPQKIDLVGVGRKILEVLETVKKTFEPLDRRCRASLCNTMMQRLINGEDDPSLSSHRYIVRPKVDMGWRIPEFKTNPTAFRAMHEYFGTNPAYIDQGKVLTEEGETPTEVIKTDWKGVQRHLQGLVAQGLPLPGWVDQSSSWTNNDVKLSSRHRG